MDLLLYLCIKITGTRCATFPFVGHSYLGWFTVKLGYENFLKILQLVHLLSQLEKKKGYKTKHLNEKPILIGI